MKIAYIFLKEAGLRTNCPECYAKDGLLLSFHQKKMASKFYNRITDKIEERLECQLCESRVYPGRWTDDIDRMYEYHLKTITPQKTTFNLTSLSIGLLLGVVLLVLGLAYYIVQFIY